MATNEIPKWHDEYETWFRNEGNHYQHEPHDMCYLAWLDGRASGLRWSVDMLCGAAETGPPANMAAQFDTPHAMAQALDKASQSGDLGPLSFESMVERAEAIRKLNDGERPQTGGEL